MQVDSINTLLRHLERATISDNGGCKPDVYLTSPHIEAAITRLRGDLKVLVSNSSNAESTGVMFDWMFGRMVALVRDPYLDAIQALTDELRQQKEVYLDREVGLKEKYNAREVELNEKYHAREVELVKAHQAAMSEQKVGQLKHQDQWAADLRHLMHQNQKLLLRQVSHQEDESVPAAATHTQTWDRVLMSNPDELDYPLPILPHAIPEDSEDIVDLVNGEYDIEADTYDPLLDCLQTHLSADRTDSFPGARVWATHTKGKRAMLGGRKPDFTITVGGISEPDPHSIIVIWEAKAITDDITKGSCGQLYTYLKLLSERQRQRQVFVGVISNLKDSIVVTITRDGNRLHCRPYLPAKLGHVITYLRDVVLRNDAHHPYIPAFSIELGDIKARLGNPALRDIALFNTPKTIHTAFAIGRWVNPEFDPKENKLIVVKRRVDGNNNRPERPVEQEISMLRLIYSLGGHTSIAHLVFSCDTTNEFGMIPYGVPIKPGSDVMSWPTILENILDGLHWLHDHDIIHRDLRWDNIIWCTDHAVIIDFGEALHLPTAMQEPQLYSGGYACVPRALIGRFNVAYVPRAQDDCFAFVQLVLTLLWPAQWGALHSANLAVPNSYEALRVEAFWRQLETTELWKPYMMAAENKDYKKLAEMVNFCAYC